MMMVRVVLGRKVKGGRPTFFFFHPSTTITTTTTSRSTFINPQPPQSLLFSPTLTQHPPPSSTSAPPSPPPFRDADALVLLQTLHQLHVHPDTIRRLTVKARHVHLRKIHLLQADGLTPPQIAKLLAQTFLSVLVRTSYNKMAAVLCVLRTVGITGQAAGEVLLRRVAVLGLRPDSLRLRVGFLNSLGLRGEQLHSFIVDSPLLLANSVDHMRNVVASLQEFGLDHSSILNVLRKSIFLIPRELEAKVEFLESKGLSKATIYKTAKRFPAFFHPRLDALRLMWDFLQQLGFEVDSKSLRCLFILSMTANVVQARFEWLKGRGFSDDQILCMTRRKPEIFRYSENNIAKKLDFLINVLKLDVEEVAKRPICLTFSLEKRIKPRFDIMEKLRQNEIIRRSYCVSVVVTLSDKRFQHLLMEIRKGLKNRKSSSQEHIK